MSKIMYKWKKGLSNASSIKKQILENRHIDYDFFNDNLDFLPDETLIKDLGKSINRVIKAIRADEKIVIFGDDDLDGVTSTYLIFDFLKKIGSRNHFYYVRNRNTDPHGIHDGFIKIVIEHNYSLVITVDGCIGSYEGVEELNKLGVDVIITDHHHLQEKIPNAYAIVNSKQPDCQYPDKMLAGVGVAFMFVRLLAKNIGETYPKSYILWTAIGSIIDKAPLTKVNRTIILNALHNWNNYLNDSILKLHNGYKFDSQNDIMNFVTYVGKILSGGKEPLGENKSLRFLISPKREKHKLLIELLAEKHKFDEGLNTANNFIRDYEVNSSKPFEIYIDKTKILPPSLLGYTASTISQAYNIPVLVLQKKDNYYTCEGRCTDNFDLFSAFKFCKKHFIQFGGHTKAAGFSINKENIPAFINDFETYIKQNGITEVINELEIDAQKDSFSLEDYKEAMSFFPFGEGNPEPNILIKSIETDLFNNCEIYFKKGTLPSYKEAVIRIKSNNKIELIDYKE